MNSYYLTIKTLSTELAILGDSLEKLYDNLITGDKAKKRQIKELTIDLRICDYRPSIANA